jgi:hypothetical protein
MKCPYCAEEIQDQAKKCRYCGEWLVERPKQNTALNVAIEKTTAVAKRSGTFVSTLGDRWWAIPAFLCIVVFVVGVSLFSVLHNPLRGEWVSQKDGSVLVLEYDTGYIIKARLQDRANVRRFSWSAAGGRISLSPLSGGGNQTSMAFQLTNNDNTLTLSDIQFGEGTNLQTISGEDTLDRRQR